MATGAVRKTLEESNKGEHAKICQHAKQKLANPIPREPAMQTDPCPGKQLAFALFQPRAPFPASDGSSDGGGGNGGAHGGSSHLWGSH